MTKANKDEKVGHVILPPECWSKELLWNPKYSNWFYLSIFHQWFYAKKWYFYEPLSWHNKKEWLPLKQKSHWVLYNSYIVVLWENDIYKTWIFWYWDVVLKDELNTSLLWLNYKWKNYNIWNLCYQNYKPEKKKLKNMNL